MAPNELLLQEDEYVVKRSKPGFEIYDEDAVKYHKMKTDLDYKHKWYPIMVVTITTINILGLYGFYLLLTSQVMLKTLIYALFLGVISYLGIVIGAHRGYSHNAFKFSNLGAILIIIANTLSGQYNLHWWTKDHRLHHKYVDTDADPYNAKRGFFFAHVGWLMTYRHPMVEEKGKTIDMSDIESNKLIMFQKEYYFPLYFLFNALAILVPVYAWGENLWISIMICYFFRFTHVSQATWSINSVAHLYGGKPFDTRISARQSRFVYYMTLGEGWHNFHHAFPYHHAVAELGFDASLATYTLDLMKKLGLVYDLKTVSYELIYKHYKRYGDGSIPDYLFNIKSE